MRTRMIAGVATAWAAGLALLSGVKPGPEPGEAERTAVVKGNTAFALELYGRVREREGNLFLSPYSISSALAMTQAGARGRTAEQMAKSLHLTLPPKDLHAAFANLTKSLNEGGKRGNYELSVANALWTQKGFTFLKDFLSLVEEHYGAGVRDVDFCGATEEARRTINAWVEKETREKIKDLLKPGVLTPDARLVLTNAIYFKGLWLSQFKKEATKEEPFHVTSAKTTQAPMMHQRRRFRFMQNEALQALELPYKGEAVSMVILLPKKVDGLADVEKSLTPDALAKWLGLLREVEVEVTLPRFAVTSEFSLKDALVALGMTDAFDPNQADFSGMNGSKDLFIQAVVHKAFVDVNEEGTEAAAATGVVVGIVSFMETPVFRADHPFLFLIRDVKSGSVLFLGRVVNPKA